MSEVLLRIADQQVATIRLDPNGLQGREIAGQPVLYMPLKLQLLPAGRNHDVPYTLLRLAGIIQNQQLGEFARFEVAPLAAVPNATPFDRHQDAFVMLDRQRVKRFEDARAGGNAHFQLALSYLIWYPAEQRFEANVAAGSLDVVVPRSQWVDKVLSAWNLASVKVIEIAFAGDTAGENFRTSYARVEEAEKLFASGQYKQVLTSLRLAFEALALNFGFEGQERVKQCFEHLFASAHPEKKQKARDALTGIYKFLHMGPHEQGNPPEATPQPVVTRQDARFALTLAYSVFQYITPEG